VRAVVGLDHAGSTFLLLPIDVVVSCNIMDRTTLTVPEAARRVGRNPETVRRWIREGRLRASKVGTQHIIDEGDLADVVEVRAGTVPMPDGWKRTFWGGPMPDWVGIIRRQREEH